MMIKDIDENKMKNLFEPFKRNVDEGEKLGGVGMVLALTKMFVELHNRKIRGESIPGKGSCFYFTIPFDKETGSKTDK